MVARLFDKIVKKLEPVVKWYYQIVPEQEVVLDDSEDADLINQFKLPKSSLKSKILSQNVKNLSSQDYEYLAFIKEEIKAEVKSDMIYPILNSIKSSMIENIKEHASLVEVSTIPTFGNKTETDLSSHKEEISDIKNIMTRINSKNESIEKRFAEVEKRIPKLETELITVRSDIAMRTTKEEFNIVMQQLPHVATKSDID